MVNIILNGTAFNVEDYGASIESADNSGVDTNFSTIRAFNTGATGNSISSSTIVKKAGGSYVDSQNGAEAVTDTNNTKTQV